jgi:hypothetical protein
MGQVVAGSKPVSLRRSESVLVLWSKAIWDQFGTKSRPPCLRQSHGGHANSVLAGFAANICSVRATSLAVGDPWHNSVRGRRACQP